MIKDNSKYIRDMFNSLSHSYDLMNSLMSFGMDGLWRKLAVVYTGLTRGGKGLDVCCGTGMLTIEQARAAGKTGRIVGIDFSGHMLAIARKNIKKSGYNNQIKIIQGDVMELPFGRDEFDCVTVGWGLRNVSNREQGIREMVRVVKPGGKVVSIDMAPFRIPVLHHLYWFYVNKVIPLVGKLICRNREAYEYLSHSIKAFITPQELASLFKAAGLIDTEYRNICGGIVAIVAGKKPV